MNQLKSLIRLSKGFGLIVVLLLLMSIAITIRNIKIVQTTNSNASISIKIQQLTHFTHVKVHHPLRQKNLYDHILPSDGGGLGYNPSDIKRAYNLPSSGGRGTIAVIDAFDTPTAEADLGVFDSQFNLPTCTRANSCFSVLYQSGNKPQIDPSNQWPLETDLDIEWAHAIAPNAKILLVETNSDNMNDLLSGVVLASNQSNVLAVSMSWGYPGEFSQETQGDQYLTSQTGALFFAAAGDTGNGPSWPSVSPNVISVGGTTLAPNGNNFTETAWNLSGGGLSMYETEPSFQLLDNIPYTQNHRATPDVSMVADPNTGCLTYVEGSWYEMGGTSLATPIWAAISTLGTRSLTQDMLYQNAHQNYAYYYHDITQGTNGTCQTYCTATTGYDYITGLGSPRQIPFSSDGSSPTPTPNSTTPTPSPTPSKFPTPTFTPTPTISIPPTPTPTINPNNTYLSVIIGFHGIGHGGDNINPNSIGNMHPRHPNRTITVSLSDLQNNQYGPYSIPVIFNSQSGLFTGYNQIDSIPTGEYQIKISSAEYLTRQLPSLIQIIPKQLNHVPTVYLISGDIDQSNSLSILDYNQLADCYGTKQNLSTCKYPPTQFSFGADLDDSGIIDGIDYNLFIRELSVQQGN